MAEHKKDEQEKGRSIGVTETMSAVPGGTGGVGVAGGSSEEDSGREERAAAGEDETGDAGETAAGAGGRRPEAGQR